VGRALCSLIGRWCLRCLALASPWTVWRPRQPSFQNSSIEVRKAPGIGTPGRSGSLFAAAPQAPCGPTGPWVAWAFTGQGWACIRQHQHWAPPPACRAECHTQGSGREQSAQRRSGLLGPFGACRPSSDGLAYGVDNCLISRSRTRCGLRVVHSGNFLPISSANSSVCSTCTGRK
jgi:hypothetical protein